MQNSELLQLVEKECSTKQLPPIKILNCTVNEVKKLMANVRNIDEAVFFKKYGWLIEIMRVEVLNPTFRALVHFWDLDYKRFSFGNIDMYPTMKEYKMLIEFHV
jgi:hypothetical protein